MTYFKKPGPIGAEIRPQLLGVHDRLWGMPGYVGLQSLLNVPSPWRASSDGSDAMCRRDAYQYEDAVTGQPAMAKVTSEVSTDDVCMDVSSDTFAKLVMGLRDQALKLVQARRAELLLWTPEAKKRAWLWFNTSDNEIVPFLQRGVEATERVLRQLTPKNFIPYTEESIAATGCDPVINTNAVAAVCAPDTSEHRIMIALKFCGLRRDNVNFDKKIVEDGDSQLLTLVHEVTHFKDVFGSHDNYYTTWSSLKNVNQSDIKLNADSLAAYILGVNPRQERP